MSKAGEEILLEVQENFPGAEKGKIFAEKGWKSLTYLG